jgi:hypothetical protein
MSALEDWHICSAWKLQILIKSWHYLSKCPMLEKDRETIKVPVSYKTHFELRKQWYERKDKSARFVTPDRRTIVKWKTWSAPCSGYFCPKFQCRGRVTLYFSKYHNLQSEVISEFLRIQSSLEWWLNQLENLEALQTISTSCCAVT